ncbi:MAG: hypothetical protein K0Q71_3812 [Thermomicrobiales bacterium]|nr:hypothetical protein [Thermomicrobiales bacterium]
MLPDQVERLGWRDHDDSERSDPMARGLRGCRGSRSRRRRREPVAVVDSRRGQHRRNPTATASRATKLSAHAAGAAAGPLRP